MQIIPLSSVVVGPRQRKKIEKGPLTELRESIRTKGLFHPPVVREIRAPVTVNMEGGNPLTYTGSYELVVGERRYTAIKELANAKQSFFCNNIEITPGHIPVTSIWDALSPAQVFEAELDENIRRVDIPWPDRTAALAELHELYKRENPKQTPLQTARTLIEEHGAASASATPRSNEVALTREVKQASILAQHLSNPKIAKARNATEAYNLVLRMEESKFRTALAKKQLISAVAKPHIELHHGDMLDVLARLPPNLVDLILADPPYGIGASAGGFRSRTIVHHNYNDTVDNARVLAQAILMEGFRVTKPQANLFLFTDIRHWDFLQTISAQVGWLPFPRPIIWGKSDSEGLAPWGSQGFRITTEYVFFATKGQKGLLASPVDYLRYDRVADKEHAAEKPIPLLKKLIECSTLPGDFILDPCCGSGSTLQAAQSLRRVGLGIEKDKDYYELAMARLYAASDDEEDAGDSGDDEEDRSGGTLEGTDDGDNPGDVGGANAAATEVS